MHQPTRKARAPRLPAGRCTVRTVPQVSAAVSELAHRTVDLLVRHGVRGSGIAVTAIYTERARIRAINRHAASLPPHAWLMVPDVDEFFHFPCRVWVRALASQVSLASQVVWYASQVVTYASQVVCLTGGTRPRLSQVSLSAALSPRNANATAATYFCATLQDRLASSRVAAAPMPLRHAASVDAVAPALLEQYPLACAFRQYARGLNTHKVALVRVRDPRGVQRRWLSSHALGRSSVSSRCISTGYVWHVSVTKRTVGMTHAKQSEARSARTRRDYAVRHAHVHAYARCTRARAYLLHVPPH